MPEHYLLLCAAAKCSPSINKFVAKKQAHPLHYVVLLAYLQNIVSIIVLFV